MTVIIDRKDKGVFDEGGYNNPDIIKLDIEICSMLSYSFSE